MATNESYFAVTYGTKYPRRKKAKRDQKNRRKYSKK